jgi:hypothetical protein
MKKAVWGPATWKLLHCMVLKVNSIEPQQMIELKNIIMRIVSNLPCPYCTAHALSTIGSSNYKTIQNINDLKLFMFQFHNKVNQQTNKPMITYDEHLPKYCDLKMQDVLQDFLNIYQSQMGGVTMMLYGFHRKQMLIGVFEYFKKNRALYLT